MGRNKIDIDKIQTPLGRQTTFSKRKSGLIKKVKDLSVLCDVEIALLMFSPGGRATLQMKEDSDLGDILARFEAISLPEREGRKRETLERLRKMMRKIKHNVDTKACLHNSSDSNQRILELGSQLQQLKAELADTNHKLSLWAVPESIVDLDQIRRMEETLINSLNQLQEQEVFLADTSSGGTLAPVPLDYFEDRPAWSSHEDQVPGPSNIGLFDE